MPIQQGPQSSNGANYVSEFAGKVVIITGSGSGIGRATALVFGAGGARVIVADCDEVGARGTAELVRQDGGEAVPITVDVSHNTDVLNLVHRTVGQYGQIDVLFSNAAIQITKSVVDTSEEEWQRLLDVNLKGTFLCCKHVLPVMQRQQSGSVIIACSGHAFATYPKSAVYAASKGGVLAFMRGAAVDYAAYGIRVNCIVPGATDTSLLRNYLNSCPDPKAEEDRIVSGIPLKRFARPEDIAKAVKFLASGDANYITGAWLAVDGGLLAHG
jgi:NAD(P)-dependent dehydrogenase (short-subunit alcohol dehydrogenase family)